MRDDPAEGFPHIMPRLRYEDVGAAISWLAAAFGFRERLRWSDQAGTVQHAEVRLGDVVVELSAAHDDYQTPRSLGKWSQSLIVLVDNVADHYARAREAGARVITEPADMPWGLRQYTAEDLAGHRWEFSQYLRHVPAADWGARLTEIPGDLHDVCIRAAAIAQDGAWDLRCPSRPCRGRSGGARRAARRYIGLAAHSP
jgi:uncharacterized glyoxalase superfamily protein PhnB